MLKSRKIVRALRHVLERVKDRLPPANVQDAQEFIQHGEWLQALDLLCTQLYEYETPISLDTFLLIKETAQAMEMSPEVWTPLEKLVTDSFS